ncbi:MAG: zinc ribbon domain-containing protein [Candidatus Coproplasma sp.]
MALFVQNISLRLSDSDYLIEKVTLEALTKENIDLTVAPGTVAYIGGTKYKGKETPYKLKRSIIGTKNGENVVYLTPDKMFDTVSVRFFGGQYVVSLSQLPTAKAKFAVVGDASVEVSDFKELVKNFNRSMTRSDLVEFIEQNVRGHLSNEVSVAVSQHITPETTEVTLLAALNDVANEVMNSRKTATALINIGLILSARGISMHLNAIEDTDDKIQAVNNALTGKAIASLGNDILDREEREREAERQHEINKIRAGRTDISESTATRNINTNTNTRGGNVVINNNAPARGAVQTGKKFCPHCGAKLTGSGKFCPECGERL